MVIKVGKFGIRSGNTFKASRSKFLRQYRKQSVLVQNHIAGTTDEEAEVPESIAQRGDINSDRVEYSLNKKARWLLPALIRKAIEQGGEDCAIQLIESHKILKRASCIGVYTTHAPSGNGSYMRAMRKKKRGYIQAGSVLNAKKSGNGRHQRQNRFRVVANGGEEEAENTEQAAEARPSMVRYDVIYPSPISSSVTHNPKYIGHDTQKIKSFRSSRSIQRRNRVLEENYTDFDNDNYFFSDEDTDVFDDCDIPRERNYDFNLEDFLHHANAATRLARSTSTSHSRNSSFCDSQAYQTKGRVVYEEPESANEDGEPAEIEPSAINQVESVLLEPVYVILPNDQVDPNNLRAMFQQKFTECECFPRKFILNISDRVSDIHFHKDRKLATLAFIIFEYDVDNEINNINEGVYKIYFNTTFSKNVKSIKIETMFDYMETNVEEVINRTCFFVETLPEGMVELEAKPRGEKTPISRMDPILKWKTESYRPSLDIYFQKFLSTTNEAIAEANTDYNVVSWFDADGSDEGHDVASPNGHFCCICYDSLDRKHAGTALIACGHWVCNSCWRQYLESKMMSISTQPLLCPEFECNKSLDPGTILSLAELKQVSKYAKRCHDTQVEQSKGIFWCPKSSCGRVLKISSPEALVAQCQCGEKICVNCFRKGHFPAPCSSVNDYHERLKKTGDEGILPVEGLESVTIHGKQCPHCMNFVEKKGGCPFMSCICGKSFCWGCGKKHEIGVVHGSECQKGTRDSHNTVSRKIRQKDLLTTRKRAKWYQVAVTHRTNQHPLKLRLLTSKNMSRLAKQVQRYIACSERRGIQIDLKFENRDKAYSSEGEKVCDWLRSSAQLYPEISRLIEHSALLVESEIMPGGNQQKLIYAIKRLGAFTEVLFSLFTKEHSPQEFTSQLVQVREHVFTLINVVIKSVKVLQNE